MPSYSSRHLDPQEARKYLRKFQKGPLRRLSSWREKRLVRQAIQEALGEITPAKEHPRLLDIPCGAGRFAPLIASMGVHYLGADHSPHMLELCSQTLSEAGHPSLGFFRCDARAMSLGAQTVDLCCCLRLIHHFPEQEDRSNILANLRRISRGPVILSFLDGESPKQWLHQARLALEGKKSRRTLLTKRQLTQECAEAGFRLTRTWSLSGLFSGQSLALLLPSNPPSNSSASFSLKTQNECPSNG